MLWHNFFWHIPRLTRHTLGAKIDILFINILETTLTAQYTKREDKMTFLVELSRKLDNLKYFITILWEAKGLEVNKYSQLSQKLATAGRMLGKWIQSMLPKE
ncbi:MAG: four helix bundle protein [Patescibacteria group bacterium]